MRVAVLVLVSIVVTVLAACSAEPTSRANDDLPSTAPSASSPSPSAPLGSGPPSSPAPSASAGGPAATPPTATGAPTLSPAERQLAFGIREDAQESCTPRRTELPTGATAGAECRPATGLVARVGVYAFPTEAEAFTAYKARLDQAGVALRSGDCEAGTKGDRAWVPGDGPTEGGDLHQRSGCFHDENGTANIRVTCGDGRYIGVLGRSPTSLRSSSGHGATRRGPK